VRIHGRNGKTLKNHWKEGPTSYLGVCVPNFPNLFMITGPNGPFTNIPPTIETHVEFITKAIKLAEQNKRVVEATQEAENGWSETCEQLAVNSLFKVTDSWVGLPIQVRHQFTDRLGLWREHTRQETCTHVLLRRSTELPRKAEGGG
jgi:hypothetical protein